MTVHIDERRHAQGTVTVHDRALVGGLDVADSFDERADAKNVNSIGPAGKANVSEEQLCVAHAVTVCRSIEPDSDSTSTSKPIPGPSLTATWPFPSIRSWAETI
jgi:hypothetical protein